MLLINDYKDLKHKKVQASNLWMVYKLSFLAFEYKFFEATCSYMCSRVLSTPRLPYF